MVVMDDELNINVYQNVKNIEETYMKKKNLMINNGEESPPHRKKINNGDESPEKNKSGLLKLPTGKQVTSGEESPGKNKSGLLKLPTGKQVTRQDQSLENNQFWKIVSNTIQLKQDPEQILEPHTIIAIEKY